MDMEDCYAPKLMEIVLDKLRDSESKLVAHHLYREALEMTGIEGYKARHAIVSHLSHVTRLVF